MKNFLTLMAIAGTMLFTQHANSQATYPYLDSTSTWYEIVGGAAPPAYTYSDYNKYFIDGDTIISGNTYYQLYWDQIDSTWDFFTGNFLAVNYSNHVYQGGLREDSTKRFYFCYQSQASESILFDFNFSVGDTMTNMVANYGCNNPPNTVAFIDTVYLGSQSLKKFHFSPIIFNKTLYEGIGSSGGLIWTGSMCQAFEWGGCLAAYKKGLDSLYINCGLGTTDISEITGKEIVNIFPNPASDNLTIEISSASSEKKELSIYNTLGQEVLKKSFTEQKYSVDVSAFQSGVYFVEVRAEKGAVRRKVIKI